MDTNINKFIHSILDKDYSKASIALEKVIEQKLSNRVRRCASDLVKNDSTKAKKNTNKNK